MKRVKVLLLAVLLMPLLVKAQKQHLKTSHNYTSLLIPLKQDNDVSRRLSKEDFIKSVKDFKVGKIRVDSAWMLWKDEKWKELEFFFTSTKSKGLFLLSSGLAKRTSQNPWKN